jgi:primosomal protein N' (replication factor Y)
VGGGPLVARVLPDIRAGTKEFDYLVPPDLAGEITVGSMVRVDLHGRRVGAWVVALGVDPPAHVRLKPIAHLTGHGPPADVIELARWTAWRWGGRVAPVLVSASPPTAVRHLPRPPGRPAAPVVLDPLVGQALAGGTGVLRRPPGADPFAVVQAAAALGPALVVTPGVDSARALAARLRRAGVPVALHPRDWALGAVGATVIGTRTAVFAPVAGLAAIVVLDEHDDALKEEQTIGWHARDVAVERARRAGVPCLLVSPCPTLEALAVGHVVAPSRAEERAGWPVVEVVDRSRDDPRDTSLVTSALVRHLRGDGRVVCVLNTKGRARLVACAACGELARCERCGAAVGQDDDERLRCHRCGAERPPVCARCGAGRFKLLRKGTARVRVELEAAAGEPVVEGVAGTPLPAGARLVVGTEAVLHQAGEADVVAFLDFDAELLAPRYRAAEDALALLARGARLLGPRERGGRLLVQTSLPQHEVVKAVVLADPARVTRGEAERRRDQRMPPAVALAAVSGAAAEEYAARLAVLPGLEVLGPSAGTWLVRAADHRTLCDALAATERPPGRLRVDVDPLRL